MKRSHFVGCGITAVPASGHSNWGSVKIVVDSVVSASLDTIVDESDVVSSDVSVPSGVVSVPSGVVSFVSVVVPSELDVSVPSGMSDAGLSIVVDSVDVVLGPSI